MSHLLRGHAPISDAGWALLDQEAQERLTATLGARKVVDFSGPRGWRYSSTDLGRVEASAATPVEGVRAHRRRVLPMTELRADFPVSRAELLDNDRGAPDVDLDDLDQAALRIARAENTIVFHGFEQVGIVGIVGSSSHPPIPHGGDFDGYPRCAARAVAALRMAGVGGPYGLALGPEDYTGMIETAEHGGYPLLEHLKEIIGGPIVWTPGVQGGVVLSLRGGDFLFESGQDLSIGFDRYDADAVHLYLEETLSFRVATPEAAVALPAQ